MQKKEEQLMQEAEDKLGKISKAHAWLREEQADYESELKALEGKLPDMLTDWALGDIEYKKVMEVKDSIRRAKEFLEDDLPMIVAGLDKLERQANIKRKETRRLAEKRTEYEEIKERFRTGEEHPEDMGKIKDLKDLAQRLDEHEDCDAFLADIGKPATK